MTLHNYRSRQVHKTLNGVNPSSSFRDMRSAKSGPNLWQIWQVFGPWASPYGANGQITMTVHNYRPRQFHRTSNGENPSSGYRDMGSASLAAARPAARPPEPWRQYPSSPKGWGVKSLYEIHSVFSRKVIWTCLQTGAILPRKWVLSLKEALIDMISWHQIVTNYYNVRKPMKIEFQVLSLSDKHL